MRNINLALFSLFLVCLISLPILCVDKYLSHPDYPWQLVPFGADSLSQQYKDAYSILDAKALVPRLDDSIKSVVEVLVDGWGVPYDEKMLEQDFAFLRQERVTLTMHRRLLGYTSHVENVEFRTGFAGGILLMQGDSLTCSRRADSTYWQFERGFCCVNCNDSKMIAIIDSLLSDSVQVKLGWTVRSTREGDREKLHEVLRGLSDVASRHPDVQFIIQGTHRPILGTPETRRKYLAPWVPAVFINCELKEPQKEIYFK